MRGAPPPGRSRALPPGKRGAAARVAAFLLSRNFVGVGVGLWEETVEEAVGTG
jgi:hypothetical protein